MILAKFVFKIFDLQMSLNGVLAGLVGITGGCAVVEPYAAVIIGIVAAFFYFGASQVLLRFQIDDPCDASPVHLGTGIWGVIATGLFATKYNTEQVYGGEDIDDYGFFTGGHIRQLGIQVLGAGAILAWTAIFSFITFYILKRMQMLRIDDETELMGLDMSHHGGRYAYDFNIEPPESESEYDEEEMEGEEGLSGEETRTDESTLTPIGD
jgi:Amt family ammonium transporter